jgi:hypothetical protein
MILDFWILVQNRPIPKSGKAALHLTSYPDIILADAIKNPV